VYAILALANPDIPMHDGLPRVLPVLEDFFLQKVQVVDSLPLEEFSALPPLYGVTEPKVISLLSFVPLTPSENFKHSPCARLQPSRTLNGVEYFQVLCARSHSYFNLPFSDLLLRFHVRPALHLHDSNNQVHSKQMRTRV
jgi:hypothetical protein